MAVPRPVLIALLGLAALVAVFLATRNSQPEAVTPPATPAVPATPKAGRSADKPARPEARRTEAPKPAQPAAKPKPADGVPPQVRRAADALAKNQVVVFFFTKPGAADDTGARVAVSSLDGMKRVKVFRADVAQVGAYRPMLSQLEISQVPATVIVRPGRQAVLLQGFVDAGTLRQDVADALR